MRWSGDKFDFHWFLLKFILVHSRATIRCSIAFMWRSWALRGASRSAIKSPRKLEKISYFFDYFQSPLTLKNRANYDAAWSRSSDANNWVTMIPASIVSGLRFERTRRLASFGAIIFIYSLVRQAPAEQSSGSWFADLLLSPQFRESNHIILLNRRGAIGPLRFQVDCSDKYCRLLFLKPVESWDTIVL